MPGQSLSVFVVASIPLASVFFLALRFRPLHRQRKLWSAVPPAFCSLVVLSFRLRVSFLFLSLRVTLAAVGRLTPRVCPRVVQGSPRSFASRIPPRVFSRVRRRRGRFGPLRAFRSILSSRLSRCRFRASRVACLSNQACLRVPEMLYRSKRTSRSGPSAP